MCQLPGNYRLMGSRLVFTDDFREEGLLRLGELPILDYQRGGYRPVEESSKFSPR